MSAAIAAKDSESGIGDKIPQPLSGDRDRVFKQLKRNILYEQGYLKTNRFVVSKDFKQQPVVTSPALHRKSIVSFDDARSTAKPVFNSMYDHIAPPFSDGGTIPPTDMNLIAAIAAKEQSCLKKSN